MRICSRILLGFSVVIALPLMLGGFAVVKMYGVRRDAMTLAADYMPTIRVANDVERQSLRTMYEMRGYAYTGETPFLDRMRTNLAGARRHLVSTKELVAREGHGHLLFLREAADRAEMKLSEYESLVDQTVAVTERMERGRAGMDAAAEGYRKVAHALTGIPERTFQAGTGDGDGVAAAAPKTERGILQLELVNDILDLGHLVQTGTLRSQAPRDLERFRVAQRRFAGIHRKLDDLKAVTKEEVGLRLIEDCRTAGEDYSAAMAAFLADWEAREVLDARCLEMADAVLAEAESAAVGSAAASGRISTAAAAALSAASVMLLAGFGVVLVLGVILTLMITRSIALPIRAVAGQLSEGAVQTASAAGQVSSGSQALAEGASEQAASLEETSSSLEEMSSMTQRNAANAQKASELAAQTRVAADAGAADMQQMAVAMSAIKASGDDIAKIIRTIDEIAFQTSILALNAAVEAARAGEAGMGFAVVADEVRNLAQRSAQAAKETAARIEGAITRTAQGVELTAKVARGLQEIVEKARQVDVLVLEVTTASQEQSQGIAQLNMAVSQMDKVVQGNAANAEEIASASELLHAQAGSLKEAVADLLSLVDGRGSAHVDEAGIGAGAGVFQADSLPARGLRKPRVAAARPRHFTVAHGSGNGHSMSSTGHSKVANGGIPVVSMTGPWTGKPGDSAADAFQDF